MKTFRTIKSWREFREPMRHKPIGFVPTMGALHPGHVSLLETSLAENAFTVVSIFVNQQQFDQDHDFQQYPTTLQSDIRQLEQVGVDALLLPDASEVYADSYRFTVREHEFSKQLCGAHRPGHFEAVLTIVMRLLNLVRPDNAYFGEKDYQQLQLVRDMVTAFFMPVNIVACPTVRESDGLAMSSRNGQLNEQQRKQAVALYATLQQSKSAQEVNELLVALGFEIDYVKDVANRRLVAARLGNTRLIDNVRI